ncbi:T9SS type A sorting domain-containing protein [Reichenbachiella carrageenanivorans]|uniref:T9SS type A sorting domain-containing protein n=1 Tax=Reichenbachiella carrageenanivorans TaxID=2979869 RepID=A0ABY6D1U8_9BACT|nr:T9SS type A sorting domain-containing protein [Reichenbachiella carrageenanivorans]UXX79714.1 T9SS type A sorting domain-containing protein [Reichenbachiella carrageenanivorans]
MTTLLKKAALLFILFVPLTLKGTDYYLTTGGSNANDCLFGNPCATLSYIIGIASNNDKIYIEGGDYPEAPLTINKEVDLIHSGGPDATFGVVTLNADITLTVGLITAGLVYVQSTGSIQDGIDLASSSIIYLYSGTYNEDLSITKNISLSNGGGSNADVTVNNISVNGFTLGFDLERLTVTGSVTLTNGIIVVDPNSNGLFLSNTASDITETSTAYVEGTVTMEQRAVGTGTFSFLGVANAGGNDLGNVTISRTTGSNGRVTGVVSMDESIDCTWQIISDNPPSIQVLTFLWFSNWDNGIANQAVFNDSGSGWTEIADITDSNTDPRFISTSGINAFGEFTIAATGDALPVELTSFKASNQLDHTLLQWQTASEINHDYFEIQRSEDGEKFEAMGRMSSHHNSSSMNNYEWKDYQPLVGKSYYRLKMVDFDGYTEYSPTVSASLSNSPLVLHPNPTSQFLNISSAIDVASVAIYNTSGQQYNLAVKNRQIDVSTLLPDIYILKIVLNEEVIQTKFIKN